MDHVIDVLLACYNGEKFLPQLLKSLDEQTDANWRIIARDDGSSDGTLEILQAWGKKRPDRFILITDADRNLGACQNFARLLSKSTAEYFMFCDQDDVWLPEKIERQRAFIKQAEQSHHPGTPILVHSDLVVVDEGLKTQSSSFWHHQGLAWPSIETPWKMICIQNIVTGCALIGNRALRTCALPIPTTAIMHDWWLALLAASVGVIYHDSRPLVLYRQHNQNTIGAQEWGFRATALRMIRDPLGSILRAKRSIRNSRAQAQSLLDSQRVGSEIVLDFLQSFANSHNLDFLERKKFLFKHNLFFPDVVRNLGLLLVF